MRIGQEASRIKLIKKQPRKTPHQEAEHQLINYINLRISQATLQHRMLRTANEMH